MKNDKVDSIVRLVASELDVATELRRAVHRLTVENAALRCELKNVGEVVAGALANAEAVRANADAACDAATQAVLLVTPAVGRVN